MPINLASPGIVVKEVDLTIGRVDSATDKTAAVVGGFEKGPVNLPIIIENEQDLIDTFGEPRPVDGQYETWLATSSYLSYGGVMSVVRAENDNLRNAGVDASGDALTSTVINSVDDYTNKGYDENIISGVAVVAKNPGGWANGLKVAIIDNKVDQTITVGSTTGTSSFVEVVADVSGTITGSASTIGVTTTSVVVGQEVRCDVAGVVATGATVTNIGAGVVTISVASLSSVDVTTTFDFGTTTFTANPPVVGSGITQAFSKEVQGIGTYATETGYLKGIITEIGTGTIGVKVLSFVNNSGIETSVTYNSVYEFSGSGEVAIHTAGQSTGLGTVAVTSAVDWFDRQQIQLTNGDNINWNTISERPGTSSYADARNSLNDEVHVIVIDDAGTITGNSGSILEKNLNLSKAKDAEFSTASASYWRKFLASNSEFIFGGSSPHDPDSTHAGVTTTAYAISDGAAPSGSGFDKLTDIDWDQNAEGIKFGGVGARTYTLNGGKNYNGQTGITTAGALKPTLANLISGYKLYENTEQYDIDFLLMGSANYSEVEAASLANQLIAVADLRKDAIAFISPYKESFLKDAGSTSAEVRGSDTITDNVISYANRLTSSTYGVFDSGYKYMFDRFANTFRYVPLNGDIAGMCARNDINNFPWFSPAGTARGAVLNAVKLGYNPSQLQRDKLYSNRVNPVIFLPGAGIVLYGDKTGFGTSSAFDRINVRRLFIYLEDAISAAAKDQLFEFNDEITRTNFVNIVEPFLRDVQAKRGIFDFRVVCDETNNTAAIIDNNEFVADIFIKPARSINFIGLTFVATRTGISFEEVIGTVN